MNNIREKIDIFKREAGEKERYNIEQQKIYSAFTKENGKSIRFAITDCKGKNLRVTLDPATEVRKILLKHYQEPTGTVTAKEILNMFDIVRTGTNKKRFSSHLLQTPIKERLRTLKTAAKIQHFLKPPIIL